MSTVRHLTPPPRSLPFDLSLRVVLGDVLGQVGWFLVGFGLIFVWAFDATGGVASVFRFSGELATVEGRTTGWRETSLSINDEDVYETTYAFEVDGRSFAGSSYATGYYVAEGVVVTVEYRASDPSISRIESMRASPAGAVIAFVFVIPLVGLAFVRSGLRRGQRARRLLAEGHLAQAALKSKEEVLSRADKSVYRLVFEFTADSGGSHEVEVTTNHAWRLEDDETERLVYDPRHPSDAVLLDDLPGSPTIDARGSFVGGGAYGMAVALLCLVLPGLTVLGHGLFLYFTR
jgi:hypothetical protein